jgi:GNAT superfamily N-acetyltransferase
MNTLPPETNPVPLQLTDGTRVILRPVAGSDRDYFRMGFRSMSRESRYRRFFVPKPDLSEPELHYFTEVDQINHVAWVAIATEPPRAMALGVARFVRMPEQPTFAAFSLAVIDAMQRKGLGRALLAMLHLLAAERGVRILKAICLLENQSVVGWLRRLGAEARGYSAGTIEMDLHVEKSPFLSPPCGTAAERFASSLFDLSHALAEARAKSCSRGAVLCQTTT